MYRCCRLRPPTQWKFNQQTIALLWLFAQQNEGFSTADIRYVREALFQTAKFGRFMAVVQANRPYDVI
nr:hypothetical protein [Muribacter muris]